MTWVSTRALVEGKEPGYGAGCGGRGDFPLRCGVMLIIGTEQSCCAQAEVLGTDRPCRGPLEFQRQRADIADGQTLTASPKVG